MHVMCVSCMYRFRMYQSSQAHLFTWHIEPMQYKCPPGISLGLQGCKPFKDQIIIKSINECVTLHYKS